MFSSARPCDKFGHFLEEFAGPPPPPHPASFDPFDNRGSFDFAHFHFVDRQDSAAAIDRAIDMQAALLASHGVDPSSTQWRNAKDMYSTIDEIDIGAVEWEAVHFRYTGPLPANPPKWMTDEYELLTRNSLKVLRLQLSCPEFDGHIHYSPYQQFKPDGQRVFSNLMSGTWSWKQCVCCQLVFVPVLNLDTRILLPEILHLKGSRLCPSLEEVTRPPSLLQRGTSHFTLYTRALETLTILLDVRMGKASFQPHFFLYPKVRRHIFGMFYMLIHIYCTVPKEVQQTKEYQTFTRQLYHACLARIFEPLRPGMTTPEIVRCPDGHFRRAIFGIGPYIADYPEQVLLSCVVSNWCPKCTAKPDALDEDADAILRTHEASAFLIENFDPGIIWSDFGVRSDVQVRDTQWRALRL